MKVSRSFLFPSPSPCEVLNEEEEFGWGFKLNRGMKHEKGQILTNKF